MKKVISGQHCLKPFGMNIQFFFALELVWCQGH
jgi:hypothetical protein